MTIKIEQSKAYAVVHKILRTKATGVTTGILVAQRRIIIKIFRRPRTHNALQQILKVGVQPIILSSEYNINIIVLSGLIKRYPPLVWKDTAIAYWNDTIFFCLLIFSCSLKENIKYRNIYDQIYIFG